MKDYRYPWPASAVGTEEMALLHNVRESSTPRVPISRLIAKAIHAVYGKEGLPPEPDTPEAGTQ